MRFRNEGEETAIVSATFAAGRLRIRGLGVFFSFSCFECQTYIWTDIFLVDLITKQNRYVPSNSNMAVLGTCCWLPSNRLPMWENTRPDYSHFHLFFILFGCFLVFVYVFVFSPIRLTMKMVAIRSFTAKRRRLTCLKAFKWTWLFPNGWASIFCTSPCWSRSSWLETNTWNRTELCGRLEPNCTRPHVASATSIAIRWHFGIRSTAWICRRSVKPCWTRRDVNRR